VAEVDPAELGEAAKLVPNAVLVPAPMSSERLLAAVAEARVARTKVRASSSHPR
jgi:hypothetical protein